MNTRLLPQETISALLVQRSIRTYFHPIISIREKRIIGFEALSRGIDPVSGELLMPFELFFSAQKYGFEDQLDLLCRDNALETFAASPFAQDHLLFVNMTPPVFEDSEAADQLSAKLSSLPGLCPESIAIELVESRMSSRSRLVESTRRFRSLGVHVVLDDFGAAHSNLDRIFQVKPDIIKIDRRLIDAVHTDYYKQSIVGSIIDLADKVGALALAEGVERLDDIIACYELGTPLFQGYYFAMPGDTLPDLDAISNDRIASASQELTRYLELSLADQKLNQEIYTTIATRICERLASVDSGAFDSVLTNFTAVYPQVECLYVIDDTGRQVTETVFKDRTAEHRRKTLFHPAQKGADHSLKAYYYHLNGLKLQRYYTEPYISLATGNICRTFAIQFTSADGCRLIACVDLIM